MLATLVCCGFDDRQPARVWSRRQPVEKRAQQADQLALVHVEADAVQGNRAAVALGDVVCGECDGHRGQSIGRASRPLPGR